MVPKKIASKIVIELFLKPFKNKVDYDRWRMEIAGGKSIDQRFEALHALYENKQQWVRHYETMLGQINPISTTLSLGMAAFLVENSLRTRVELAFITIPLVLICFTVWFNWWCDREIRRQFDQIVIAEKGMGFYDYQVDGKAVLPKFYEKSPQKTRPIILAGYVLQAVSLLALIAAIAKSLSP